MAQYELRMPKLGESVTEGTIGRWLVRPGDTVLKYDLLVEVQTDKVNTEIPSPVSGTLREVRVEEGVTVPVGALLALVDTVADVTAGAAPTSAPVAEAAARPASASVPAGAPANAAVARPAVAPGDPPSSAETLHAADRADVRATPAVRKLASDSGVDLRTLTGTGLGGRVSRQDVEAHLAVRDTVPAAAPVPAPVVTVSSTATPPLIAKPTGPAPLAGDELLRLTPMRRAIAENMVRSWSAPHAHAVMEIDMTAVMRYRETVRGEFIAREGFDLSPAAFIMKAAVEALRAVPRVNASWTTEGIRVHRTINLGYAVSLGDDGLVVPVIGSADGLSIAGLMRAIRDVVDRAKLRKLSFEDFSSGTFTVNNTGPLGTVISSPIVPPGQAAIVSAEAILKRLVVTGDDQIGIRQMMNLVIGFDHRVVDGATAAKFLATMRVWLEGVTAAVPVY